MLYWKSNFFNLKHKLTFLFLQALYNSFYSLKSTFYIAVFIFLSISSYHLKICFSLNPLKIVSFRHYLTVGFCITLIFFFVQLSLEYFTKTLFGNKTNRKGYSITIYIYTVYFLVLWAFNTWNLLQIISAKCQNRHSLSRCKKHCFLINTIVLYFLIFSYAILETTSWIVRSINVMQNNFGFEYLILITIFELLVSILSFCLIIFKLTITLWSVVYHW